VHVNGQEQQQEASSRSIGYKISTFPRWIFGRTCRISGETERERMNVLACLLGPSLERQREDQHPRTKAD
jgi:hypothetical protein